MRLLVIWLYLIWHRTGSFCWWGLAWLKSHGNVQVCQNATIHHSCRIQPAIRHDLHWQSGWPHRYWSAKPGLGQDTKWKISIWSREEVLQQLGSREVVTYDLTLLLESCQACFSCEISWISHCWKMERDTLRGIRVASGVDAGVLLCCILFIDGRSQGFFWSRGIWSRPMFHRPKVNSETPCPRVQGSHQLQFNRFKTSWCFVLFWSFLWFWYFHAFSLANC